MASAPRDVPPAGGRRVQAVLLGLLILLGAGLRFHGLGRESLWNDELDSVRVSAQPTVAAVLAKTLRGDGHPPTFNLVLHFVRRHLGSSEAMLRLPSAACGVLSIAAIFVLGRLLYGPAEGLVAAGLLAVLWCPVYYSQEARPYACLLLAVLAAGACWAALLRRWGEGGRASPGLVAGFLLSALAACYLHHFGAGLALLLGGGAVLLARGRARRAAAATFVLLLAGYGPGLWYLALQKRHAHSWDWIPPPGFYSVGWYLKFLFNESRILPALALAVGLLALAKSWRARRRGAVLGAERPIAGLPPSLLLTLWLAVPFAGAVAVSYLAFPLLTSRNLIVCLPAAYLLLARAFTALASGARLALLAGLVLLFLLAHLLFVVRFYRVPEKEQFREAVAAVVAADPEPDPAVAVLGCAFHREYFDHYFARLGSRRRLDLLACGDESLAAARELLDRARPRRVWLLRGHRGVSPAFLAFLRGRCAEREHRELLGADVWRFEAPATIAPP
jgi:mannosyltransferase